MSDTVDHVPTVVAQLSNRYLGHQSVTAGSEPSAVALAKERTMCPCVSGECVGESGSGVPQEVP